jgi:predicted amidohydrolase
MLLTRRELVRQAAAAAAVAACVSATASAESRTTVGDSGASDLPGTQTKPPPQLRIATCQFPVSGNTRHNAVAIEAFMRDAARAGAHLLHTSEACLTGYAGTDLPTLRGHDWRQLREQTSVLRQLCRELRIWLVLGSAHYLDEKTKPTNCLYLIDPNGQIANRYDKCFLTEGDQTEYTAGDRLVTHDIHGIRIGLAICYDICWPQHYIGYREENATVMLHSFHNARMPSKNCLETLIVRQVPTRCADNRIWAVCNNSSQPESEWGSFVARPDATIAKQLGTNRPGMLIHEFPDGLSEGGWYHNHRPMLKRDDEIMTWGTASSHPRQRDGRSEP